MRSGKINEGVKAGLTLTSSSWREDCVWGCSWCSSLLRLSSVWPARCQVTSSCSPWAGHPPAPAHLGQGPPLQGRLLAEVVEEALPLGAAEGLAARYPGRWRRLLALATFLAELVAFLRRLIPCLLLAMSLPGVVVERPSTIKGWRFAWVSMSPLAWLVVLPGLVMVSTLPPLGRPGAGGRPAHALLHQVEPLGHGDVGVRDDHLPG